MKRILKIGMDVHSTNYTLCAMEPVIGAEDWVFANIQVTPVYKKEPDNKTVRVNCDPPMCARETVIHENR